MKSNFSAKNKPILIKLGGSILNNKAAISSLCQEIKTLRESGFKLIIVHGGSKAINEALAIYGIESQIIQGMRKTSLEAIQIIEMVLCGQVNQALVRHLNQIAVPAVGLSGAGNNTIVCDYLSAELGFVGEIKTINPSLIHHLLEAKEAYIPVIASLGVNESGTALNINADFAASCLANTFDVQKLIYITDQQGIYDRNGKLLTTLSETQLLNLVKQSIVKDGMLVKVKAILQAMQCGLDSIFIANGNQQKVLTEMLINGKNPGTLCTKNREKQSQSFNQNKESLNKRKRSHHACRN